jgi:hypothetical protein
MILQLVTTKETGEKIQKHFDKFQQDNLETNLHLGDITDYVGYTIIPIDNIHSDNLIDIFWLGFFVGIDFAFDSIEKK